MNFIVLLKVWMVLVVLLGILMLNFFLKVIISFMVFRLFVLRLLMKEVVLIILFFFIFRCLIIIFFMWFVMLFIIIFCFFRFWGFWFFVEVEIRWCFMGWFLYVWEILEYWSVKRFIWKIVLFIV